MNRAEFENLKRFFLGELSDTDAREVDLRIMSEPEFEAELTEAEEMLIEEYLDGELTPERRILFETNFLSTPARIVHVEIVAELRRRASERVPGDQRVPAGILDRFRAWLGSFGSLTIAVPAAALILVTAGLIWFFAPAPDREIARLNSLGSNPKFDKEYTIGPGEYRGAAASVVDRAGIVDAALFRLAFPFSAETASVEIYRDGARVASLSGVAVAASEIRIFLPRAALEPGSYKFVVEARGIPTQTYIFTVK